MGRFGSEVSHAVLSSRSYQAGPTPRLRLWSHAVDGRTRTPRDGRPTRSAQITHLPTPVEPSVLHGVRHLGPGSSERECKDNPIGIDLLHSSLPQPARLALPLQQHEDVALTDRTLDVPHDRARGIVEELDAHLDHRAGLASAAEDLGHLRELDGLILRRGKRSPFLMRANSNLNASRCP